MKTTLKALGRCRNRTPADYHVGSAPGSSASAPLPYLLITNKDRLQNDLMSQQLDFVVSEAIHRRRSYIPTAIMAGQGIFAGVENAARSAATAVERVLFQVNLKGATLLSVSVFFLVCLIFHLTLIAQYYLDFSIIIHRHYAYSVI
jgi:hypothetical protein